MSDLDKKKVRLEKIIEKLKALPEAELDYAAGVITGMSALYDRVVEEKGPAA